jgi:hypothetical protein
MMLVNKTTSARKKRGRCQIWRDRPVRSRIVISSKAATNPATDTTKIQGMNMPKIRNSGRLATPNTVNNSATDSKLSDVVASLNGLVRSKVDGSAQRWLV